jgi:hypothetical protein
VSCQSFLHVDTFGCSHFGVAPLLLRLLLQLLRRR